MANFQAVYYRAADGTEPVREFIAALKPDRLLILLHILPKNTKQIPEAEKQIARDRWDDFKARMDADPRVPPRAAGQDAP
jgi:phage-related protein